MAIIEARIGMTTSSASTRMISSMGTMATMTSTLTMVMTISMVALEVT